METAGRDDNSDGELRFGMTKTSGQWPVISGQNL
jgi:hypothetical protein